MRTKNIIIQTRRHVTLILGFTLLGLAVGVFAQDERQSPAQNPPSQITLENPKTTEINKLNSTYPLVPGDKIRFRIADDPKLNETKEELVVSALGLVDFPVSQGYNVIVQLPVSGKTLKQVSEEITARLNAEYYFNTQVSLQLVSQTTRTGVAHFHGSARGPISLEPGVPKTLSQALIEIGWDEFANLKKVKIQRRDPETNKPIDIEVNVYDILQKNKQELDVLLIDGDRIHVPERSFLF